MGEIEIVRLDARRRDAFYAVHSPVCDAGWCRCAAWWLPSFEGFGERTAEDNLELREELFERGEHDGYLLYAGRRPVAWCQVGPRDRFPGIAARFALEPDPATWAIGCFLVVPPERRRGHATRLLAHVLADLPARGAARVEAYPKRGAELDALELWNGPEAMLLAAGFEVARDDPARPVLARSLR